MTENEKFDFHEILEQPRSLIDAILDTDLIQTEEGVKRLLRTIIESGYFIVPQEPTNVMFEAYMTALNSPPSNRENVLINLGKARKRFKAMALAGTKIALSNKS